MLGKYHIVQNPLVVCIKTDYASHFGGRIASNVASVTKDHAEIWTVAILPCQVGPCSIHDLTPQKYAALTKLLINEYNDTLKIMRIPA